MKKPIITISFLLISLFLFCQSQKTDSIFRLYKESRGEQRVEYIYQLSTSGNTPYPRLDSLSTEAALLSTSLNGYSKRLSHLIRGINWQKKSNNDSAFYHIRKFAEGTPTKNNYPIYLNAWYRMAMLSLSRKDQKSEDEWLEKISSLSTVYNDSLILAYYYYTKAKISFNTDNKKEAVKQFRKAESLLLGTSKKDLLIQCYTYLIEMYYNEGKNNEAIQELKKAVKLEDSLSYKSKLALYMEMDRLAFQDKYTDLNRITILKKSLEYAQYLKNNRGLANAYSGLSIYFSQNDEFDSALIYNKKSAAILHSLLDDNNLAINYQNSFAILLDMKNYSEAEKYADSAMIIFRQWDTPLRIAIFQINLSILYREQGLLSLSKIYLDSVDVVCNKLNQSDRLYYLNIKSDYYKTVNDYKNALIYIEKSSLLQDSLLTERFETKLEDVFVKYNTKQKEQENIILKQNLILEKKEKETEKTRKNIVLYLWIATFLLLVVLVVFFILFRKNTLDRRALNKENTLRLEKENQVKEQEKLIIAQQRQAALDKLSIQNELIVQTNNSLIQRTEIVNSLNKTLKELRPYTNKEGKEIIIKNLSGFNNFSLEATWQEFESNLMRSYPNFFAKLMDKYPDLTKSEKRLCAFVKMGMTNTEVQTMTNQKSGTLRSLRYRTRKKMFLSEDQDLKEFLDILCKE